MSPPTCGESTGVFYLVRSSNPLDLTRRFAESYLRYPAGTDHRLALIFKGFQNNRQIAEHCSLFGGAALCVIDLPDVGYDIEAYRAALERSECELCCFFNSYSIIRASGWLAEFSRCARDPRVGIVGATGSYESALTGAVARLRAEERGLCMLRRVLSVVKAWTWCPAFPNPHIRTNGFMIRRDVSQRVRWPRNPSRIAALRFESGRRSLTRQVLEMGLDLVIVGSDGRRFGISEWPSSGTFRQDEQRNLLVADNRTIEYSAATPELRRQLAAAAWGSDAAR